MISTQESLQRTKETLQDLRRLLCFARQAEPLHEALRLGRDLVPCSVHECRRLDPCLRHAKLRIKQREIVDHIQRFMRITATWDSTYLRGALSKFVEHRHRVYFRVCERVRESS